MEQQELQELIAHPERLNEGTLPLMKKLVERYPYFQTAWILYLKNLFVLQSPNFKEELRRGSLYVADLSVLFYYIEGDRFSIKKHKVDAASQTDTQSDRTLDLIDQFLSELPEHPVNAREELPIPMEIQGDYTSVLLSEIQEEEEEESAPLKGQELIDQFIEKSESDSGRDPEIIQEEPQDSLSEEAEEQEVSALENNESSQSEEDSEESYFTETLAKIYVKQQRYDKALEIIKKLNLKYPKKNAYFADQIRFLEKLIINAKSK